MRPQQIVATEQACPIAGARLQDPLKTLLAISGAPFIPEGIDFALGRLDRLGETGQSIRQVLEAKNGFFCFESALRFFPSRTVDASYGIVEWNSHDLWKFAYQGLADDVFCFAEDIFGRQFAIVGGEIAVFEPETGKVRALASTFEEWAACLLGDHVVMTGYGLAHVWQAVHGPLPPCSRLMPKRPLILGGDYSLANFIAVNPIRLMRTLGGLARHMRDLADGAHAQFSIA